MQESKVVLTDKEEVLLSTAILAKVLKTSPKSIAAWHRAGMPKVKTGWWDLSEVLAWRGQCAGGDKPSDEARKLKADADFKETKAAQEAIKLATEEGRYMATGEVTADLKRLFMVLKKSFLAMGHNIAIELNSFNAEAALLAKKVVDDIVYDALAQISQNAVYEKKRK